MATVFQASKMPSGGSKREPSSASLACADAKSAKKARESCAYLPSEARREAGGDGQGEELAGMGE